MVLYLSFLRLTSQCLQTSTACEERPMERNPLSSDPTRCVDVVEGSAPSDPRHCAPIANTAGIRSASLRPPSKYKWIACPARSPSDVALFDLLDTGE